MIATIPPPDLLPSMEGASVGLKVATVLVAFLLATVAVVWINRSVR